jgi:hypothetical protein
MRAGEHGDTGILRSRVLDDLARFDRLRNRDHYRTRTADVGRGERVLRRRVAEQARNAERARLVEKIAIALDQRERMTCLVQRAAYARADASESDQNDVARERQRRSRGKFFARRPCALPGAPREPAIERGEQQRVEADRENRAGEDKVAAFLAEQAEIRAEPGEDEL